MKKATETAKARVAGGGWKKVSRLLGTLQGAGTAYSAHMARRSGSMPASLGMKITMPDHDAEIAVARSEDHLVAGRQLLQDFEARERATALLLKVLNAVTRFDHDQVTVQVGLVGLIDADIKEPLLDQSAYLRGGNDAAGNLGITKDEHW